MLNELRVRFGHFTFMRISSEWEIHWKVVTNQRVVIFSIINNLHQSVNFPRKVPHLERQNEDLCNARYLAFSMVSSPHVGIVTTFIGLWVSEACLVTWRDLDVLLSGIDTPRKGFPAPSPFSSTRLHNLDVFLLCSLHWKGFLGRICCRAEKEFPLVRTAKYFTTLVAVKAYSKSKKRTSLIASQQLVVSWGGGPTDGESY